MSDIEGLDKLLKDLDRLAGKVNEIIDTSLDETATEIIADTQLNTPVLSGDLRRSWTHGEVEIKGNEKVIELGSSLEYAKAVEEGHRQGSKFKQGRFMLRDAMLKNEDKIQQKINEKIREIIE